jgi:hypothetical protein
MGFLNQTAPPKQPALTANRPTPERIATYGNRPNGAPKGAGYYGEIKDPYREGTYSTELTIGVTIDGREMQIPTIVPGLTQSEIHALLQAKTAQEMPESVVRKAVAHAKLRMKQMKDPYAEPDEWHPLPQR